MLYRVVLIFPDSEKLAGFIEYLQVRGEASTQEKTFVGNLTEEQIKIARRNYGAYVRVMTITGN